MLSADALGDVTETLGLPEFSQAYRALCQSWLGADYTFAFILPRRATPRVRVTSVQARAADDPIAQSQQLYFREGYRTDPNLRRFGSLKRPAFKLIDAHRSDLEPTQREVYRLGDLSQLLTLVGRAGHTLYCSGVHKAGAGAFAPRAIADMQAASFTLLALLHRHDQLLLLREAESALTEHTANIAQRARSIELISAVLTAATALSPREAEICARVTLGFSNLAAALDLGVSEHTIAAHRARAFAKLGVSRAADLFGVYREALDRLRTNAFWSSDAVN